MLKSGQIPIYESGLKNLISRNVEAERIHFTIDPKIAIKHAAVLMIAVGTPADEDGSSDLKNVVAVAKIIAETMENSKVIVTKSTVPVGTADVIKKTVSKILANRGKRISFHVASNPEFLKEGDAVNDFMKPDRFILGCDDKFSEQVLRSVYAPFNRSHDRCLIMDTKSAELTKYASNAMLATKISFMNELAQIAERVGADIEQIRVGIGPELVIRLSILELVLEVLVFQKIFVLYLKQQKIMVMIQGFLMQS